MGEDPPAGRTRAKRYSVLMGVLTSVTILVLAGCAPVSPAQQDADSTLRLSSEAVPSTPPPTKGSPVAEKQDVAIKTLAVFTGQCRLRLITGFFLCDRKVAYAELKNGRAVLTFMKGDVLFSVSGGRDRQPNLEDYYLGVDTIRMKQSEKEEAVDHDMEGECHFHMNKPATKFFDIRCDVYNRAKGSMYNFYLEKIHVQFLSRKDPNL